MKALLLVLILGVAVLTACRPATQNQQKKQLRPGCEVLSYIPKPGEELPTWTLRCTLSDESAPTTLVTAFGNPPNTLRIGQRFPFRELVPGDQCPCVSRPTISSLDFVDADFHLMASFHIVGERVAGQE